MDILLAILYLLFFLSIYLAVSEFKKYRKDKADFNARLEKMKLEASQLRKQLDDEIKDREARFSSIQASLNGVKVDVLKLNPEEISRRLERAVAEIDRYRELYKQEAAVQKTVMENYIKGIDEKISQMGGLTQKIGIFVKRLFKKNGTVVQEEEKGEDELIDFGEKPKEWNR